MIKRTAKNIIKVFEAFAGYGGASFGLKRSGVKHKVVGFSEIDSSAIQILETNFPKIKNYGDIKTIADELEKDSTYLPDFDMFTGGFPCQPFSSAGLQLGEEDKLGRGTLIYEIIRICRIKKPQYILLENVKGFKSAKFKKTRDALTAGLGNEYDIRMEVLNTMNYGIPQNRERLWIFAYKGKLPAEFSLIPPMEEEYTPPRLHEFLDQEPPASVYLTEAQVRRFRDSHAKHGCHNFSVNEPLCFDVYNHKIKTNGLCNTITEPSHNITRIIEPRRNGVLRIRKLSIDEQFRLMGFKMTPNKKEIKFPETLNYTQISARAGNGWDVNLVGVLIKHIFKQL